jgi:CubicO group peptidase (beta-lactamase class C family)
MMRARLAGRRCAITLAAILTMPSIGVPPATGSTLSLSSRIDAYMQPYLSHHLFKGVLLIAHGEHVDFMQSYSVSATSAFRIASITKTFTAAAIELLAQRNQLKYTDPIGKFLPHFPNGNGITVEMLLLHQAGLADPNYAAFAGKSAGLDDVIADVAAQKPLFAPGSKSQYSNAGYVVLSRIIEVVSGLSYESFIEREFTAPLHLANTRVDDPHAAIPGRLGGYVPGPAPTFEAPVPFEEIAAYSGSGNLLSSAQDLLAWTNAVAADRIVNISALKYPYGWGRRGYLEHRVIEQSGEENGFISYVVHDYDANLTAIVLSNLEVDPNDRIGKALYQMATVDPPVFPMPYSGTAASPKSGSYVGPYGTFTVSRRGADFYARWQGATVDQYLEPIGPRSYFVPQDGSTMTMVTDSVLLRQWNGGEPVRFVLKDTL